MSRVERSRRIIEEEIYQFRKQSEQFDKVRRCFSLCIWEMKLRQVRAQCEHAILRIYGSRITAVGRPSAHEDFISEAAREWGEEDPIQAKHFVDRFSDIDWYMDVFRAYFPTRA